MDKLKHILLTAALLLCSLAVSAYTSYPKVGGIAYKFYSENLTAAVSYLDYHSYYDYGLYDIYFVECYNYNVQYSGKVTIPSFVTYNGTTYAVTSIGERAFQSCSELTGVTIPEGVTSIGSYAFYDCSSLTDINIPEGVTSIGNYAFEDCRSLTSITLPESVTSIGRYAFYKCRSLTDITIPASVTSIGSGAFSGCSSLTSIALPEGVTSIVGYAFTYCSSLTSITIPEGVMSIGSYAFGYCSSLTSITLPEGVTSIGDCAFYNCSNLTSITCEAVTPPTVSNSNTFSNVDKSIPVLVPAGSVNAYKSAQYWSEFTNILPLANEYTLSVSDAGYATMYLDYAVKIPEGEGVEVYIASSVEGDRLLMTQVTDVLPANTGVIVRAAKGDYTFTEIKDEYDAIEGNLLVGTTSNEYVTAKSGYKYYVLAKKDGVVGMYRPSLNEDGQFLNNANKAYLALDMGKLGIFDDEVNTDEEGGQLSNRLRFDFGGTTGIEQTTDNGQQTTVIYDLHGRRITDTEGLKGIYIVGGKKTVIK